MDPALIPMYKHDCIECIFLGTYYYQYEKKYYDLYYCTQGSTFPTLVSLTFPTLVSWWGDAPSDYLASMKLGKQDFNSFDRKFSPMAVAYHRAMLRGLVNGDI